MQRSKSGDEDHPAEFGEAVDVLPAADPASMDNYLVNPAPFAVETARL